jgi:predicted HTH domain antitoxin
MKVHVECIPEDVLVEKGKDALEALAREALVVRLFALSDISAGYAAELLDISRREFLDLAGQYNVSTFDDTMDIAREAAYGD